MAGADPKVQYHLAADASKMCIGGVLFQLHNTPSNEDLTLKNRERAKIIMFLSYRLNDAETRYSNTEHECLAVVRCLAEVRWLVMGSRTPTMVYTDHQALKSILTLGTDRHGQIAS